MISLPTLMCHANIIPLPISPFHSLLQVAILFCHSVFCCCHICLSVFIFVIMFSPFLRSPSFSYFPLFFLSLLSHDFLFHSYLSSYLLLLLLSLPPNFSFLSLSFFMVISFSILLSFLILTISFFLF